jgi:2-oxoglutarate dehydrogenase E1 component
MPEGAMKAWIESSHLSGANAAYIEELYESYLDNSQSVSTEWRDIFQQLPKIEGADVEYRHSEIRDEFKELAQQTQKTVVVSGGSDAKQVKVLQLINAFRFRGHQNANLDPLGLWQRDKVRDLQLSHHELSENDFDREFKIGSLAIGQDNIKPLKLLTVVLLVRNICISRQLMKSVGYNSVLNQCSHKQCLALVKRKKFLKA